MMIHVEGFEFSNSISI